MNFDEKKLKRFNYLKAVFDRVEDNVHAGVGDDDVAQALGLSQAEAATIQAHLVHLGLLRHFTDQGVAITHAGVIEMEARLEALRKVPGEVHAEAHKRWREKELDLASRGMLGSGQGEMSKQAHWKWIDREIDERTKGVYDLGRPLYGAAPAIGTVVQGDVYKTRMDGTISGVQVGGQGNTQVNTFNAQQQSELADVLAALRAAANDPQMPPVEAAHLQARVAVVEHDLASGTANKSVVEAILKTAHDSVALMANVPNAVLAANKIAAFLGALAG